MRMTRRKFVARAGAFPLGLVLAGCCKSESDSDKTAREERENREKMIKAASLIGVMIGERIVKFPHPALRILGVLLILSGELAITYLALKEGTEQTEKVKLTQEEAQKLDAKRRLAFVREDGKVEERAIDEVKSSAS